MTRRATTSSNHRPPPPPPGSPRHPKTVASLLNEAKAIRRRAKIEKANGNARDYRDMIAQAEAKEAEANRLKTVDPVGQALQQAEAATYYAAPASKRPAPQPAPAAQPRTTAPSSATRSPSTTPATGSMPATPGPVTQQAPLTDDQIRQKVQQDFPAFSYLLDDPEVGKILLDAVRDGYTKDQFAARLYSTDWWKTHSDSARQWDSQIHTDPAAAKQKLLAVAAGLDSTALKFGVKLDPTQRWVLADNSIRFNWTQDQMNAALGAAARQQGSAQGALATSADGLVATARQYGTTLPRSAADDWATKIAEGTATQDGFTHYVTQLARARFANDPDVLKALDQGINPSQYFAPHVQALADTLDVTPSQIDLFNDPKYSQITQYYDPQTKQKRSMTIGETQQLGRDLVSKMPFQQRPQWWKQQDAQFGLGIAKLFGGIAA